jgi:hypothetical protein
MVVQQFVVDRFYSCDTLSSIRSSSSSSSSSSASVVPAKSAGEPLIQFSPSALACLDKARPSHASLLQGCTVLSILFGNQSQLTQRDHLIPIVPNSSPLLRNIITTTRLFCLIYASNCSAIAVRLLFAAFFIAVAYLFCYPFQTAPNTCLPQFGLLLSSQIAKPH